MHSVCCCCIPIWRRSPLEKEPLIDLFLANCLPPWIRPWVEFAEKPINRCVIMSTSSLSSFVNIHQVVPVGKAAEEILWRRNPSLTYFWQIAPPPLDPTLGGVCRKAYKQVRDYEYFISIKFHKHPWSGSVGKADYVFQYIYTVHALVHPPPPFLHLNKYIKIH